MDRRARIELVALLLGWALAAVGLIGVAAPACADPAPAAGPFGAAPGAPGIPEACRQYQRELFRQAHNAFGTFGALAESAPAVLAAQMQQESSCRSTARSPFAAGLTQFTPATARDMTRRYPTQLGAADPLNPTWAITAQALYMRDLTKAYPGRTLCDTWAFGLSCYNGGAGWLLKDQAVCRAAVIDVGQYAVCVADRWFGHVELTPDRRRAPHNIVENRGYPQRILLTLLPRYVAAGYGAAVLCPSYP